MESFHTSYNFIYNKIFKVCYAFLSYFVQIYLNYLNWIYGIFWWKSIWKTLYWDIKESEI